MKTLKKIINFWNSAPILKMNFKMNFKKIKEFVKEGDTQSAWQTVLGNIDWLKRQGLDLDILEVEKLANGVAIRWYESSSGQIWEQCKYKDGKLHGLYESWNESGQLQKQCKYKDGEIIDGEMHER
jgi:antitoxin component YwqK of YwqJK toxin-antitoxin module